MNIGFFDRIQKIFVQKQLQIKMSSVMPFTFNVIELCVLTINEKLWTRAREVCRAVEYQKGRARDVLKSMSALKTNSINMSWKDAKQRIQRRKRYVKLKWFDRHFPDHEVIVEIDNPNSIHVFNHFEEEGHVERRYNRFRLIDLTREELYVMKVPAILEEE